MKEKRKHERVSKTLKSEVHGPDAVTLSKSADLSNGGIFITTPEPLESGSQVEMSLYIPGEEPIRLKGVVMWKRENESDEQKAGMGIEFLQLDGPDAEKIKKML